MKAFRFYSTVFLFLIGKLLYGQNSEIKPFAPELFPPTISGAVCGFSADGKTIFFVREDSIKQKLFLWQAKRKGRKWVNAQLMPFSGQHNDVGGRLSADGKTFYFTSDRPGGSGKDKDAWNIWTSQFTNSTWSEPAPLKTLNDKGMECCPVPLANEKLLFSGDREKATSWWISSFDILTGRENFTDTLNQEKAWQWPSSLDAKNKILFLNSMGRADTKGMDDIYVSFQKNGTWTKPINIGEPVNTKVYEDGAILSYDKKYLIFCRHDTHATPSRVVCIEWKPLLKRLKDLK